MGIKQVLRMTIKSHPFLLCVVFSSNAWAQFDFNQKEVKEAYKNILKLKVDVAKTQLANLRDTSKFNQNGVVPLLENYLDIITLLTTENKVLYKKLKPNEASRIREIKSLNQNSPLYLYTQADIKLQWAFVELIFEDYVSGFIDLKRANELIEANIKKYPNYKLNNKVKGLIDLLTEAAPEEANIALYAAGLSRSTKGSEKLVETSVFEPFFKTEIDIYLAFTNAYIKNDAELAMWKIEKTYKDQPDNLFALFTYVNILSKLKMHQNILNTLKENPIHRKKGYLYIPYIDYLLGETQLNLLQYTQSITSFRNYLSNSQDNTLFCANTCYKLAITYNSLRKNDSANYYLDKILEYPSNDLYLDQYAVHFTKNNIKIESTLSRSRLLFDGGEYQQTYDLLIKTPEYKNVNYTVEKYYRLGSCARQLGKNKEFVEHYVKCVNLADATDYNYYAAYACLQLGYHYQSIGETQWALKYFKQAKVYKNHFYYTSVKDKADLKIKSLAP